jgi:hypothetical protein
MLIRENTRATRIGFGVEWAIREFTGNFCIDEDTLQEAGMDNFEKYAVAPRIPRTSDLFVR